SSESIVLIVTAVLIGVTIGVDGSGVWAPAKKLSSLQPVTGFGTFPAFALPALTIPAIDSESATSAMRSAANRLRAEPMSVLPLSELVVLLVWRGRVHSGSSRAQ